MVLMGSGVGWQVKVEAELKVVGEEKCCEAQASVTYALLMGWAGQTGALVKGASQVTNGKKRSQVMG